MKRGRVVAVVMFVMPLVVTAIACTFPEVAFEHGDREAGAARKAGGSDAADSGAANEPDVLTAGDVAERNDATARVDASECESICDCDHDHYFRDGCDAGEDAAEILGAGDCDDLDPLRHPNAGLTNAIPVGHDGDWNCDGTVDREPKPNLTCGGNGTTGCTGGTGFLNAPPCGQKADFYSCEPQANLLLACKPKPSGSTQVTQLCK